MTGVIELLYAGFQFDVALYYFLVVCIFANKNI